MIAKRYQYSGATAFIRAFQQQYSLTPEAYRQAKPRLTALQKPQFLAKEYTTMFDVTFTQLEEITLAYLPHQGDLYPSYLKIPVSELSQGFQYKACC
ncbi:hypothetical protein C2869_04835 [Saccharobesus litoralis]|uniref:HTH araC/xylS-type domain-containing protein n=1 Tax=Saccharobesus litoralis TaxID=2172099 RepID=A0A2S0VNK9_9ALTE|nr:AraC family transcriptional regulator [Saccharobesus litoralis]AWB65805.1 hypothetical protein C2869_04835 [Saccharobesus litoralis]